MKKEKQAKPQTPAEMGRKGGKAGKGKSKVRGDAEYYRKLSAARKGK